MGGGRLGGPYRCIVLPDADTTILSERISD